MDIVYKLGLVKVLKLVIDSGTDINKKDNDGKTALHHSVANGHTICTEILIQNGADINSKDWNGETVLQVAMAHGNSLVKFNLRLKNNV